MTPEQNAHARRLIATTEGVIGVQPGRVTSDVRHPKVSRARHIVSWALLRRYGWDVLDVARIVGRSRGTVSDQANLVTRALSKDPWLRWETTAILAEMEAGS